MVLILVIWVVVLVCVIMIYRYLYRHNDRPHDSKNYRSMKNNRRSMRMCGRSTPSDVLQDIHIDRTINRTTGIQIERLLVFGTPEEIIEIIEVEVIEDPTDAVYDEILVFAGRYYKVEKDNKLTDITDTLEVLDDFEVRLLPLY